MDDRIFFDGWWFVLWINHFSRSCRNDWASSGIVLNDGKKFATLLLKNTLKVEQRYRPSYSKCSEILIRCLKGLLLIRKYKIKFVFNWGLRMKCITSSLTNVFIEIICEVNVFKDNMRYLRVGVFQYSVFVRIVFLFAVRYRYLDLIIVRQRSSENENEQFIM